MIKKRMLENDVRVDGIKFLIYIASPISFNTLFYNHHPHLFCNRSSMKINVFNPFIFFLHCLDAALHISLFEKKEKWISSEMSYFIVFLGNLLKK